MVLKKKIRILMISSSSSLGGGTKHMFMLGKSLNNDFKVYYAIPKNNNFLKYLRSNNHIEIAERALKLNDILNLIKFIKSNSIEIIHAHGKGAGIIARIVKFFINKPLIYTFHGIHLKCHSFFERLIYLIYEYLFGWIDSMKILVSKSEKYYAKSSKIYLGSKSTIINNGVLNRPKKFSLYINDLEEKSSRISKITVITICRLVKQKNIEEIIWIALKMPKLEFILIGDGPLMPEISNLITKLKIENVFLLGQKDNIFKFLYEADIYLSTSFYEGLPISILEAMSVGIPIVASNVIGNCDTIENGKSGFLYDLKNIDMAVNYLQKLANNKKLREEFGDSAYKRQRNIFSKNNMIIQYLDLYKNIVK